MTNARHARPWSHWPPPLLFDAIVHAALARHGYPHIAKHRAADKDTRP